MFRNFHNWLFARRGPMVVSQRHRDRTTGVDRTITYHVVPAADGASYRVTVRATGSQAVEEVWTSARVAGLSGA